MDYNFKKFEGRNVRLEDRITITKSYSIGFPTKFYKDTQINKYKYVVLFYDDNKKAIALHFINDENEKNKFAVVHSKGGFGGSVVVRSFFKSLNINPAIYYGRYDWEKINHEIIGEIFVINLKINKKTLDSTNAESSNS